MNNNFKINEYKSRCYICNKLRPDSELRRDRSGYERGEAACKKCIAVIREAYDIPIYDEHYDVEELKEPTDEELERLMDEEISEELSEELDEEITDWDVTIDEGLDELDGEYDER